MGGMPQVVSELYGYNMSLTTIFSKTYVENTLQCLYKDYSSLNRWQASRDLLSTIYFCNDVPTKYPLVGWCESQTRTLKTGLLEDSLYCALETAVCRAMSHDHVPRPSRDLGMSCDHFHKTWIHFCNVCSAVHTVLNVWALWHPIPKQGWSVLTRIHTRCQHRSIDA
jgi:hypothetical protein